MLGWGAPSLCGHHRLCMVPRGTLLLGRSHWMPGSQQCPLGSNHAAKSGQGPWGWQPEGEGAARGEGASWLRVSGAAGAPVTRRSWCCAPDTRFCWAPLGSPSLVHEWESGAGGQPHLSQHAEVLQHSTGHQGSLCLGIRSWWTLVWIRIESKFCSGLGAPCSCRLLSSPCLAETCTGCLAATTTSSPGPASPADAFSGHRELQCRVPHGARWAALPQAVSYGKL